MRIVLLALVLMSIVRPLAAQEGVPAYAELLADCSQSANQDCAGQQAALAPQWSKALRGDYLALKNFAFCLGDGCYGAFKVDPVMACAFRIVIAARAGAGLAQEDRDGFNRDCGPLDANQQPMAKLRARSLNRAITAAP